MQVSVAATRIAPAVSEDRVTVLCRRTHDVIGTVRTGQPSCVVEPSEEVLNCSAPRRTAVASTIVSGDRAAGATAPRVYAVVLA